MFHWLERLIAPLRDQGRPSAISTLADLPLRPKHDPEKVLLTKAVGQKYYRCGHIGPRTIRISWYGEESLDMDYLSIAGDGECPECMLAALVPRVIRCGLCRLAIMPHDLVIRYQYPVTANMDVVRKDQDGKYLGCTRMGCAPDNSGAMVWDGEKTIPLENFPSTPAA